MNETTVNNKSIDTSINRKSVFVKRPENNNRIAFLSSFYILNVFLFIREYGYMNVIKDFINVVKDKYNIK